MIKANERVSRDLLEFKRLRNRTARFSERDMERAILRLVDEEMELRRAEPDCYQDFLSPYERAELLRRLQPEMEALQASYDVPPFPPFDLESARANWSPIRVSVGERRQEIELHYDRINRRVAFRFERFALRSAGFLRRNVPERRRPARRLEESSERNAALRRIRMGTQQREQLVAGRRQRRGPAAYHHRDHLLQR